MRLGALSDLHFPESGVDLEGLVQAALAANVEALVLVGDAVSQYHPDRLRHVLSVLRRAAPVCIFVPGNHELWSKEGSTAALYEVALPQLAQDYGFHYLDAGPVYVGDVAVVGNVGWYDFSLVHLTGFPGHRVALGDDMLKVARRQPAPTHPLEELTAAQLEAQHLLIIPPGTAKPAVMRWNDARFVRLGVTHAAFAQDCAKRLSLHLAQASLAAQRVVVATHTVPFAQVFAPPVSALEGLLRAYLGATCLGDAILEDSKVVLSVFGHWHRPGVHQVKHLTAINVTARPDRGGGLVVRDV